MEFLRSSMTYNRRIHRAILLLSASLLSVVAFGQTPCVNGMAGEYPCSGVDMLSLMPTSTFEGSTGLNDIWGWSDSDGREYALVGTKEGTAFVEVTDPIQPRYLGFLPTHNGVSNTWRDVKVYADHAFIVSEIEGHGMQVIGLDQLSALTDEDIPVIFSEDAHYDGFGGTHNIAMNEETGYAYPIGDNSSFSGGPQFLNVQDPVNPILEGGYGDSGYSHDAEIVTYIGPDPEHQGEEIYFGSHGSSSTPVVIVDITDKSDPQLISESAYDTIGYCHQGWLTEDQRYYLTNDETDETNLGVPFTRTHMWDLLDLENPEYLGYYESPTPSSDHNLYIKGDLCYQSNYRSGLRILDISNVGNGELEEVAFFDLYPQNDDPGYQGTWSNYPYFESGNIIITHRELGLFVLRPTDEALGSEELDALASTSSLRYDASAALVTLDLLPAAHKRRVSIVDVQGRQVSQSSSIGPGELMHAIDVSELGKGSYIILIEGENREVLRFLVSR